jgi:hypothetical protein
VSVTVAQGGSATFSVTATGTAPLTFQWRRNGTPRSGATASSLTLSSVQPTDAGSYDVVVANAAGSVTSSPAVLTVQSTPTGEPFANGSFESGYTRWTATGNQGIRKDFGATDGVSALAFNAGQSTPNAVLSQRFGTTPGRRYTLAFDLGVISYNQKEQRMEVKVQGSKALLSQTLSISTLQRGVTQWTPRTFSFVADSAETTLTFRDVSPTSDSTDMVLDRVRVTEESVQQTSLAESDGSSANTRCREGKVSVTSTRGGMLVRLAAGQGWYEFQRSEDLTTWFTVARVQADPEGTVEFEDAAAPEGMGFYRAVPSEASEAEEPKASL